ncbi:protein of unknown function (plasmid) [Azospirillum baldaniorum]|uniref:Uncharacterized protein n=1 Tax=Azospirillum baldaniorum TaxID=1064539 RepID=A0A9P1NQ08_9PROT|nr:protein of unknown function [Azospirillum baldaniorum]
MTLRCESPESGEALAASVRETLAAVTKIEGCRGVRGPRQPAQRWQGHRGRPRLRPVDTRKQR